MTTTLALVLSLVVAYVDDDPYKMSGYAHGDVLSFPVLALLKWSYFAVALYYAYCALERQCHVERTGVARMPGVTNSPH